MANTGFIENWNRIISFKIKESDLANPSEGFLFQALISYLKMFGIDDVSMAEQNNHEDPDIRRIFKIRFCTYIDHMYTLSTSVNNFVYYDLLHPSRKKTTHMLNLLLNYLLYYNMVKDKILSAAQKYIKQREDLLEKRANYLCENGKAKANAEMIDKMLGEYATLMPTLKAEVEDLQTKYQNKCLEVQELSERLKIYDTTLMELKIKETELRSRIVSDDEVISLNDKKLILEQTINEQKELKEAAICMNQETSNFVREICPVLDKFELILERYPEQQMVSVCDLKKEVQNLQNEVAYQQSIYKEHMEIVESLKEKAKMTESMVKTKESLEKFKKECAARFQKLQTEILMATQKYESFRVSVQKLLEKLTEQKEISDLLCTEYSNYI